MSRFNVKKVAVLGAGVMGAQIAAHLVNVKVPVVLFDLPASAGPKSAIAEKAIANLKKLKPSPIGVAADADLIQPANYEEHMKLLKDCDLVIEAKRSGDWKEAVAWQNALLGTVQTLFPHGSFKDFSTYNVGLEKARFNAGGWMNAGPCRPPYHLVPEEYLAGARLSGERWAALHKQLAGAKA